MKSNSLRSLNTGRLQLFKDSKLQDQSSIAPIALQEYNPINHQKDSQWSQRRQSRHQLTTRCNTNLRICNNNLRTIPNPAKPCKSDLRELICRARECLRQWLMKRWLKPAWLLIKINMELHLRPRKINGMNLVHWSWLTSWPTLRSQSIRVSNLEPVSTTSISRANWDQTGKLLVSEKRSIISSTKDSLWTMCTTDLADSSTQTVTTTLETGWTASVVDTESWSTTRAKCTKASGNSVNTWVHEK